MPVVNGNMYSELRPVNRLYEQSSVLCLIENDDIDFQMTKRNC